jgi:lipopolysaccharide export system permease protein
MKRLDRYILRQLIAAFGFFLLVFTGVIWLTQAVRLIDTVIASGQGAKVFLEFSALVLPQVFVIVLPLSAIGAALYALNKLYSDSELVVMMAAGLGPAALLRPVAIFGAMIAAAMAVVLMELVPRGGAALAERTQSIRSDLANALIVERQFLHPIRGLTLFIGDTDRAGEMRNIFLHDQRDPARPVTYSAEVAVLLRDGDAARLVMGDGLALALSADGQRLSAVEFEQFIYDLSELVRSDGTRRRRPEEYSVRALLNPTEEMLAEGSYSGGRFIAEAHYKLTQPLLAMIYPMIALVTLLAGGYRRSGFGRRVFVAVGVALVLQAVVIVTRSRVQDDAGLWPAMYLPVVLGIGYVAALTYRLSRQGSAPGTPA